MNGRVSEKQRKVVYSAKRMVTVQEIGDKGINGHESSRVYIIGSVPHEIQSRRKLANNAGMITKAEAPDIDETPPFAGPGAPVAVEVGKVKPVLVLTPVGATVTVGLEVAVTTTVDCVDCVGGTTTDVVAVGVGPAVSYMEEVPSEEHRAAFERESR